MLGLEAVVRPDGQRDTLRARLRGTIARDPGVVVGDRVYIGLIASRDEASTGPRAVVERVEPRRNALLRPDPLGVTRPLAANLDLGVIVVTPDQPPLRLGLVDRTMAALMYAEVEPLICLNKVDLDPGGVARGVLDLYAKMGVEIWQTCASSGEGISAFAARLAGQRSVMIGHSGVGKSSLARALIPGLERKVGAISESIGRGRHTTTVATLLELPTGGELVDTPGIRAFGLAEIEPRRLASLYPDFAPHAQGCKFLDCTHRSEPACTVRAQVKAGAIDAGRYERYLQLYEALLAEEKAEWE